QALLEGEWIPRAVLLGAPGAGRNERRGAGAVGAEGPRREVESERSHGGRGGRRPADRGEGRLLRGTAEELHVPALHWERKGARLSLRYAVPSLAAQQAGQAAK